MTGNAEYVSYATIQKSVQISNSCLKSWADAGKVRSVRALESRKRFYHRGDVNARFGISVEKEKVNIAYIRVSSRKQADAGDLNRQRSFMRERYPDHEVVADVGSGINFRRKGLLSVLERARGGGVGQVVVAHRDRLCRIAFDLVRWSLESCGAKVVVHNNPGDEDSSGELADDLLAITTVFVCRHNGRRSYGAKRKAQEAAQEGGGAKRPRTTESEAHPPPPHGGAEEGA
jgi:predicted site-specific integrase-resolvase